MITHNIHNNATSPRVSRDIQPTGKCFFIRSSDVEDNQGDMSSDPSYVDSRGEGWAYSNTATLHRFCYNNYSTLLVPIVSRSETNSFSEDPQNYYAYIYIFAQKWGGGGGRKGLPHAPHRPFTKRVVSHLCFNNGELRPKSWKLSFKWLSTNFWAAILVIDHRISLNFIWLLWVVITPSVTSESTSH